MPEVIGVRDLLNKRLKSHEFYRDGIEVISYEFDRESICYRPLFHVPQRLQPTLSDDQIRQLKIEVCQDAFQTT